MSWPFLALDTSTPQGGVALGRGEELLGTVSLADARSHTQAILPAIDELLKSSELTPRRVAGIVVGSGPGSFTGVRVAGATAKGLVGALGVPLYAYSSLLAQAACARGSGDLVCALFDARRDEVYAGAYRFGETVEVVLAPGAYRLDDVLTALEGETCTYVGEGAERHRDFLAERAVRRAGDFRTASLSSALLWLADRWPDLGLVAEPSSWEPEYLRPAGAERMAG